MSEQQRNDVKNTKSTNIKKNKKKVQEQQTTAIEAIEETVPEEKKYDLDQFTDLIDLVKTENETLIKQTISEYISKSFANNITLEEYELIVLYDKYEPINNLHSNSIYTAISNMDATKNILMFLLSDGGKIEPAYLISKACKRLCKDKFVVTIPRRAKSAATLISLGANEIHMGLLSELGPIDPQINGFPALGLTNALEKIASLSEKFPKSSDMFAKYLTDNLNIKDLGYFERINESAIQYATRLLEGKEFAESYSSQSLANHFTNHYKDHNFVIDVEEALKYFGTKVVKENTAEIEYADYLYNKFHFFDLVLRVIMKKRLRIIGSSNNIDDIIIENIEE